MNWMKRGGVLVCLLLMLVIQPAVCYAAGPEHTSTQAANDEPVAGAKARGGWVKIATDIQVLRITRRASKEPEFAILRLSRDKYADLKGDPKGFLNKLKIFSQKVNDLATCESAASDITKKGEDEDRWLAVIAHWPGSKGLCSAYPGWEWY